MQMVRRHRRLFLLTLMVLVSVSTSGQSSLDSTRFSKYPYIYIMDDDKEPTITDEQFYKVALKVLFPVDVFYLDSSQKSIQELLHEVIPQLNTDSLIPHSMMIRGAASPEGPYRWNRILGEERAAHTFNYINRHLSFQEEKISYDYRPEDYRHLLALMKEAKDPQYRFVKSLVDKYYEAGLTSKLKQHLLRIDGGKLWGRLYKTYFPQLRTARVILFFKKPTHQGTAVTVDSITSGTTPDSIAIEVIPEEQTFRMFPLESLAGISLQKFTGTETTPQPLNDEVAYVPVKMYRRHILGIRTNLLYDFFYLPGHYWAPSPNIQLEYYPKSGHITANLGFTCPYWHFWDRNQFWQIRDYVIEGRYYLKGQGQFIGPYAAAYIHNNIYGIGLSKTKGWEGEGLGAGAIIGYTTHLTRNKRWRMEFSLGFGYYRTKYDPYVYGNPKSTVEDGLYYYDYLGKKENFKERNHVFTWLGPTNLGVHLTYDLLYRRIQKKGVSFNRSELFLKKKGGAYE